MVSFSWAPGPCLIQTEMVKGSFMLVLTMPSGTLMAWVPLNSNTWSLSCPLSVGNPTVQLAELLGAGRSSTVPELAPEKQSTRTKVLKLCSYCSVLCAVCTVNYHKACAGTSQSMYHGRILFQCGWSPVQYWLGWRWLAHHRSLSACWGKVPDCLCQVRIQFSYWSLSERRQEREEWKNVLQHSTNNSRAVSTGSVNSNYSLRSTSVNSNIMKGLMA